MQISKEKLNKWKSLTDRGDNQKLAAELEMNQSTVSRVLRGKSETTLDKLQIIEAFYKKKVSMLAKIEKDN